MKRDEFFKTLILKCNFEESENINENTILEDLEDWDSLMFINVLSIFKSIMDITISIDELKRCKTFNEVLNLAEDKYEE